MHPSLKDMLESFLKVFKKVGGSMENLFIWELNKFYSHYSLKYKFFDSAFHENPDIESCENGSF